MAIKHVVNFSGGLTSARLVLVIEGLRASGELIGDVEYLFADTGAEHPDTYRFIKEFVSFFSIDLTCIRAVLSPVLGVGPTFKVIDVSEIGPDLSVWRDLVAAYGTPFNPGGGFCTDMLKSKPSDKYCEQKYGRGGFYKWIGYRVDEVARAWGQRPYSELKKMGADDQELAELMTACLQCDDHTFLLRATFGGGCDAAADRVGKLKKLGFRFMFEVDQSDKLDIKKFWSGVPFSLKIPEYLGNCVFCIKKGTNKIELARRAEPGIAADWAAVFEGDHVRDLGRSFPSNAIYRGKLSLEGVAEFFKNTSSDDLLSRLKHAPNEGAGTCEQSCSAFGDQLL